MKNLELTPKTLDALEAFNVRVAGRSVTHTGNSVELDDETFDRLMDYCRLLEKTPDETITALISLGELPRE